MTMNYKISYNRRFVAAGVAAVIAVVFLAYFMVLMSTSTPQPKSLSCEEIRDANPIANISVPYSGPIYIESLVERAHGADLSVGASDQFVVSCSTNRTYTFYYGRIPKLIVIDTVIRDVVAEVGLPGTPTGIAFDPKTNTVWVAHMACTAYKDAPNDCELNPKDGQREGSITEIDGVTNKVKRELPFSVKYHGQAINPIKEVLYAVCCLDAVNHRESLLAINTRTGLLIGNLTLDRTPVLISNTPFYRTAHNIAVNPETNMVYIGTCKGGLLVCGDPMILIVNGTSMNLQGTVQFESGPRLAVNPRTNVVYTSQSSKLVAMNGTTGKVLWSVDSFSCAPVGDLAVNMLTNRVYATSAGYLLVFDGANGQLVNMYSSIKGSPQYIAFNPKTRELYTTLLGHLMIFPEVNSMGHVGGNLKQAEICPLP